MAILDAVAAFDSFAADNDPYGEGDFGPLTVEGERLFFKIDDYGLGCPFGQLQTLQQTHGHAPSHPW